MSTLLKDLYSKDFYKNFSLILEQLIPSFDKKKFIQKIFVATWEQKELKERMKHTTSVLQEFFPKDFKKHRH